MNLTTLKPRCCWVRLVNKWLNYHMILDFCKIVLCGKFHGFCRFLVSYWLVAALRAEGTNIVISEPTSNANCVYALFCLEMFVCTYMYGRHCCCCVYLCLRKRASIYIYLTYITMYIYILTCFVRFVDACVIALVCFALSFVSFSLFDCLFVCCVLFCCSKRNIAFKSYKQTT